MEVRAKVGSQVFLSVLVNEPRKCPGQPVRVHGQPSQVGLGLLPGPLAEPLQSAGLRGAQIPLEIWVKVASQSLAFSWVSEPERVVL